MRTSDPGDHDDLPEVPDVPDEPGGDGGPMVSDDEAVRRTLRTRLDDLDAFRRSVAQRVSSR